ncbi:FecR family protein [Leeuwenhoekiella sp. MAR_2009_132]|uniref:FecR family protein n=1 Tax=Leeuwenhoekiella sp. MAR_2009_132 TaxID=1392489 RepID=UPI0006901A2F|nr:FecR domain-containing protein [Leeuwenhoekiella sp. MAR_2009_132]
MNSSILYKYFNNEASEEEVALLFDWIAKDPLNKKEFIRLKTAWTLSESSTIAPARLKHDRAQLKLSKKIFKPWRYAGILIVLVGVGLAWFATQQNKAKIEESIVLEINQEENHNLTNVTHNIITTLEGTVVAEVAKDEIHFLEQKDTLKVTSQLIKVPFGKTYKIILSEGSVVYLNAGSSLQFPSSFTGKTREVRLTGEGFFDIAKNENQPFIVHAARLNVRVLGTRFNVQAYAEMNSVETALEEGRVQVGLENGSNLELTLIPGEVATYIKSSKSLIKANKNIEAITAWTRGELLLNNTPSTEIFRKLERHFNVKILNDYEALNRQTFSGAVKLERSIEEILQLLKLDTPFDFTIKNNQITITQPSPKN